MRHAIAFIGVAAAFVSSAMAGEPAGVTRCHEFADPDRRIKCYDEATGYNRAPNAPPVAAPLPPPRSEVPNLIDKRWGLEGSDDVLALTHHYPTYFMPARYSTNVNQSPVAENSYSTGAPDADLGLQSTEMKFQYSLKARLGRSPDKNWAWWVGYTQQSHWQVYNGAQSRPFRETDYEPEAILSWRPDCTLADGTSDCDLGHGVYWRLLNLGYLHQSNGRGTDFSRSWNRIYAQFGLEQRLSPTLQHALLVRPWVRVKENPAKDDNQDITDYYGYGDIVYVLKSPQATLTLTGRGNPGTRKGAAQVELSYRPPGMSSYLGPLGVYFQFFTGYGESLIDYNWRQTTFGVGLSLNDIL